MAKQPMLDAAARAYALVCFADGRLVPLEDRKFPSFATTDPALANFDAAAVAKAWSDAVKAVSASKDGKKVFKALIAEAKTQEIKTAAMRAAQAAVVADREIKPQEDVWVARIAEAFGLDPASY
ncbi:MAG: TerB family tellurite resistance protein [Maricaulaceae bacterium]|jgi:tellurite resistance protein